ncbi:tetratricopeptide repeat protein 1-like [Periplaneta americana]|uniref:Tetratricopeptide repeat protein 1 n=1 Tax=Periplaneta americana TaxID=6978 RepID=A0ABQ8TWM0_PERAM|nr:hypothetical protein ANN_02158 [Periplaneta americana]
MAEKVGGLENNEATTNEQYVIPSNEEIIDSLTKDLTSTCIKENEARAEFDKVNTDTVIEGNDKENCVDSSTNCTAESDDTLETEENKPNVADDFIDEEALKDLEVTYTTEEKERLRVEAAEYKSKGNDFFKAGEYKESAESYTLALRTCPLAFKEDRAIMYSNRAAAKIKLDLKPSAVEDCTKAIELNSEYLKAYVRRAQLYEETEKLDEALADYQKILQLDPHHKDASYAVRRLPDQINQRNEQLKQEMLGKLKDLGNMILRPFGLSTDNFKMTQDPNSGGYSVNFQQSPQ